MGNLAKALWTALFSALGFLIDAISGLFKEAKSLAAVVLPLVMIYFLVTKI